ncbi:hypothetical protein GALMADRAFT_144607 [Galerina marginata CBS 339.88]|uniref:CFEM domain-containing protein n=1 Tax=Galerina marginata (strain CBS 339.88) TaxID=685588 RepID=A0A067SIF0_GALM3|nr:hypothetical protein GALMADRAFT_144607 [Galerina marginata CBS 339.88]
MQFKSVIFSTLLTILAVANGQVVVNATTATTATVPVTTLLPWPGALPPCALNCANKAAVLVGCRGATDFLCICRKKAAFIAAFLACVAANCLAADVQTAQTAIDATLVCPIVDPVPTETAITL